MLAFVWARWKAAAQIVGDAISQIVPQLNGDHNEAAPHYGASSQKGATNACDWQIVP
jgi:hypothetical protein